jgi:hypothetical protein
LFHDLGVGSYLIWTMPEQRVFVDTRIELYRYEQWRDYIFLTQGRNVDVLAAKYGFDGWLVNNEEQAGLVAALDADSDWQRIFTTPQAVLFGPRTAIANEQP